MNLFNDLWIARDGATECKSPVGRSRFINQMMWLLCAVFTFFIKYRNVDRYTMTTLKALQAYVQGLQNRSLSHRFHGYQSLPWAGGGLLVFLMRKKQADVLKLLTWCSLHNPRCRARSTCPSNIGRGKILGMRCGMPSLSMGLGYENPWGNLYVGEECEGNFKLKHVPACSWGQEGISCPKVFAANVKVVYLRFCA